MTRDETKTVLMIMMTIWPNYKPEMTKELVDIWHDLIGDLNHKETLVALKSYAQTDTSGFAPTVGQIRAKVVELTTRQGLSEGEAWEMVLRAVRRSGYYAVEEFHKLPPELQEAVGGPETLRAISAQDESELGFAKAGIMKNFQIAQARQKERLQLSDDIRALVDRQKALPGEGA